MKITIDRSGDSVHTTIEREPMSTERFEALCKLARTAIGGIVLIEAIHMVGIWAIAWAVGALVLVGLYKVSQ